MWCKLSVSLSFIFLLCVSCGKNKKQANTEIVRETKQPSLELLWQTDSLLTTCESVLYDKASKTIYVSNINVGPWDKDENGFISTINTNGDITELKWLEGGLSAPKGMGMFNGKLYVNDIDDLVEIDIKKKQILNKYTVADNPQLNDITVSSDGVVYTSGSNSNAVHKLENDEVRLVAKDSLGRMNGLLWENDILYYLNFKTNVLGTLNFDTKTFNVLTEDIEQADGLVRLENGDFIASGWSGQLFYIHAKDWTKTLLLDTRDEGVYAADIDYIPETQTLLVPTFFHNRVMAYKVNF
ncbi:hypothetical protein APS56_16255 [Pseudalgibacter alginicilyticus]|uniref:Uncharacterized protein n=1 Tax=Pseudalgibacter alginicilyticus TaxID=1736674 RepID=A0A0P0D0U8_9FLAO|nr:hypothetical protein [Pseudalgibacter alginicilyticus]ALJ06591.1 hypothetical protein APS56_16255 [Pseudalgibacter alginicilyticus]